MKFLNFNFYHQAYMPLKKSTVIFLFYSLMGCGADSQNGVLFSCNGNASGSGTIQDPYRICSTEDLDKIRNHLDKHFALGKNLDLSELGDDYNWTPIGSESSPFQGSLNGQGFKILNLKSDNATEDYIGFFAVLGTSSVIYSLTLEQFYTVGKEYVGSLAGLSKGNLINISILNSKVSGEIAVGGLIGRNEGEIKNSISKSEVTGSGVNVGGLIGFNSGNIINSLSESEVIGDNHHVGGLVGLHEIGKIESSSSTSQVTGELAGIGGLVGVSRDEAIIEKSFSSGQVKGGTEYGVGGLVGLNRTEATINESYSSVSVEGGAWATGGLVGGNETGGKIMKSYATGTVFATSSAVGGFAGINTGADSRIDNSYSMGSVEGAERVGGFIGNNSGGALIANSYSHGAVHGTNRVGGFVGSSYYASATKNYSTGGVTGGSNLGGFLGLNAGGTSLSDCFWDIETSGRATSAGGAGAQGKTTAEMKQQTTFTNWILAPIGRFKKILLTHTKASA